MTNVVKFSLAAVVVAFAFSFAAIASAVSASAIYTPSSGYLMVGSGMGAKAYQASNVVAAQTALNACVPGTALVLDGKYGPLTKGKFMAFQASVGVAQDGIIGPITAGQLAACSTVVDNGNNNNGGSNNGGSLSGGAGSVSEYKLLSSPANLRQVGEDESDVKVLGLSIEADDGSDLNIKSMKLDFNRGTASASTDLEDVATDVSIWYGSNQVANVDADAFTDDNSFVKTISFDEDAVVEAGEIGKFYIALSGINNLDSGDQGDTWTVDVTSVRFEDADGAIISEDPSTAARTFSVDTFSTANDVQLKLTEASGNPDAQVVEADDNSSTDGVVLFKGKLKATGSDILIKELTTTVTPSGTGDASEIASQYILKIDGDEVQALDSTACEVAGDCDGTGTATAVDYVFNDVDFTISEGDTVEFEIIADIAEIDGATVAEGDALSADVDSANIVAEDQTGEDVTDLVGSITGNDQAFYSTGLKVDFISATASKTHSRGDVTGDADEYTAVIKFKGTAFGSDVYVDKTNPDTSGGATESDLDVTGSPSVSAVITSSSTTGTNGWKIAEDDSETFTITVTLTATTNEYVDVSVTDILYALTDVDGNVQYTFNLDDFNIDPVYVSVTP